MPQVRKLTDEDVRTIERKALGQRKATELEYDRYLAEYAPGDYGEVTLQGDEKRLTVRNRLKAAAGRHNPPLALEFARIRGDVLRFRVNGAGSAPSAPAGLAPEAETPPAASPAPEVRKRGPRTATAEVSSAPAAIETRKRGPRKAAAETAPAAAPRPRKARKSAGS